MTKVKPLRRLYFQFGAHCTPKLDAYEVAQRLESAGLIEYVAFENARPTYYREAERLTELSREEFEITVMHALEGTK